MKIELVKNRIPVDIIDIHNQAFHNFFLTSLGSKFLELFYTTVLKSSEGLVLCLKEDDGNIRGFAVGTTYSRGFYKRLLLDNFCSYFLVLFTVLISRPKAIFRLIKNLKKKSNSVVDNGDYAELLSIAVPLKYAGNGYGKLLLQEFEHELLKLSVKKNTLTTDYYNNEDVIKFYQKMGYDIYYDFWSFPNRRMYKLIKNL